MEIAGYHSDGWLETEAYFSVENRGTTRLQLFLPLRSPDAEKMAIILIDGKEKIYPISRGTVTDIVLPETASREWKIALLADCPEETVELDERRLGFVLKDVLCEGSSVLDEVLKHEVKLNEVKLEDYFKDVKYIQPQFDPEFYRLQLGRRETVRYPELHYFLLGWRRGLDPTENFSTSKYLQAHADVLAAGINPLYHFLAAGKIEGRQIFPSEIKSHSEIHAIDIDECHASTVASVITEYFDDAFYMEQLGNDRAEVDSLALHYIHAGWRSGLDPSPKFSTQYYLDCNPDVSESGVNPFYHYITEGRKYGRLPSHPGGESVKELLRAKTLDDQVEEWLQWNDQDIEVTACDDLLEIIRRQIVDRFCNLILSICHDDYRVTPGGIQLCIQREQELAQSQGIHYLAIFPAKPIPRLLTQHEFNISSVDLVLNGEFIGRVKALDLVEALSIARAGAKIKALIIHQLMGQAPELISLLAAACGVRQVFLWVHDFFSICPSYALQRNSITFCGAPRVDSNACELCLYGSERKYHVERVKQLFEHIDVHVVSPSAVALQVWEECSTVVPAGKSVIPHMEVSWDRKSYIENDSKSDDLIHLAFTGTIAGIKGWNTFERLARNTKWAKKFKFSVLSAQKPNVSTVQHEAIQVTASNKSAMIDRLRCLGVDFVIHWARWPETFSFSTYEAIAAGAYVLTNEGSGNVAAYVLETGRGIVFGSEADLFEFLNGDEVFRVCGKLRSDRASLESKVTMSDMTFELIKSDASGSALASSTTVAHS